jgi:alpha-beta hydrolase superfamily lysophospholipase
VQLLQEGKEEEGKQFLLKAIPQAKGTPSEAELHYLLAVVEDRENDYKSELKDLQRVLELDKASGADNRRQAFVLKRIGDCYYKMHYISNAVAQYKVALMLDKTISPNDPILSSLLEAILGALMADKKYADAQVYGEQLLQVTGNRALSGRSTDIATYFWAQLELLNVYKNAQNQQGYMRLRESTIDLLNRLMTYRAQLEAQGTLPPPEVVRQNFLSEYVRANNPRTLAEYLWLAHEFRTRTLPLIEWPAANGSPKATILCVHGLGLENRAFTAFGHEMAKRGYTVLAMDVRGFGSWAMTKGVDEASFEETISDIGSLIQVIRQRIAPGLPLFLLGESMGGGIALRAGAEYPREFQGIIASVPSAERFEQGQMTLKVAVNFLKGANKDFDIASMVANKATSDPTLQKIWENDPKAKLKMSPIELMKFDGFMRNTVKRCKGITTTPVLILQGLKDKLVKPEGTFEMFQNVQSEDKSILVIGNAEHLMFERESVSPIVIDSVATWLDNHLQPPAAASQPSTVPRQR